MERNFECAAAEDAIGRAMTSASRDRSGCDCCAEYPGIVCALTGTLASSATMPAIAFLIDAFRRSGR
jgi:hypothetical protein